MSHFSKIKTKISNKTYLIEALEKMNYQVKTGNYNCVGYQGNSIPVEILINLPNNNYNIGFALNNGYYELVADWYGIREVNSDHLLTSIEKEIEKIENKIKQQYAYLSTVKNLKDKGFQVVEETNENGEIHIQLRRLI